MTIKMFNTVYYYTVWTVQNYTELLLGQQGSQILIILGAENIIAIILLAV